MSFGGGRRVALDEVAKFAILKQKIAFDLPTLQKIDEKFTASKKPFVGVNVDYIETENDKKCPVNVVRAGLFSRLVSVLQGNNVRTSTIKFLADCLNADITPVLNNHNSGTNLSAFLSGKGLSVNASGETVSTDAAFSAAGLIAITLSQEEIKTFSAYPFIAIGTGCLLAVASQTLLKSIDSITSLSCEVVGVNTAAFDGANFEVSRQHRGQMQSAANLRLLLEGSKGVNKELCSLEQALQFRGLPQITGPCQEAIAVAVKAMNIELNSSETADLYDSSQAVIAIKNLVAALGVLTDASRERQAVLGGILKSEVSLTLDQHHADSVAFTMASSYTLVETLSRSLAKEVFTSLSVFANADAAVELANKVSELKVQDAEASAAAAQKGKGAKPEEDDSKYTPEQLAKVEKVRREKAEKAAAKAAEKAAKKAGASVVLGAGATLIRNYFTSHCRDNSSSSSNGAVSLDRVVEALNPFDLSEDGLAAFCVHVMEQLSSTGVKRKPKIPKGTRDYFPEQMRIREQAFLAIRRVFKRHGGVEIDTPVFELKEVLTGKYGEDSKLIYDLADQGGELLSLRYDLTVPFARFLAMNTVGNIKRYHIAKVYRRDQPQLARGRYREFYQCDFDIAGSYSSMVPDAEVISVAAEILAELPVGPFLIKLNHRKLLDAIFDICGVPMEKFRPICSAIDKLDKSPWAEVKAEMTDEKGLSEAVADRIGEFVLNTGKPKELWAELQAKKTFGDHVDANIAMTELHLLFSYLEAMGSLQHVSFDLSLARGLDYYTGVIYEAVLIDGTSAVGSIAAGGRYDNLVGMFSPAGVQTPCVGVSIGIERVFTIMEKRAEELKIAQTSNIQVYIASIGSNTLTERMKIANLLWKANISAEYSHQDKSVNFKKQMDEALERNIPFMVVFGQDELNKGVLKIKNMRAHTEIEVPYAEIVERLLGEGAFALSSASDLSFLSAMKESEKA